jgi:hypothetical protein
MVFSWRKYSSYDNNKNWLYSYAYIYVYEYMV